MSAPSHGDSDNELLRKILDSLSPGIPPIQAPLLQSSYGDSDNTLLRKIAELVAVTPPSYGDSNNTLLRKIAEGVE